MRQKSAEPNAPAWTEKPAAGKTSTSAGETAEAAPAEQETAAKRKIKLQEAIKKKSEKREQNAEDPPKGNFLRDPRATNWRKAHPGQASGENPMEVRNEKNDVDCDKREPPTSKSLLSEIRQYAIGQQHSDANASCLTVLGPMHNVKQQPKEQKGQPGAVV